MTQPDLEQREQKTLPGLESLDGAFRGCPDFAGSGPFGGDQPAVDPRRGFQWRGLVPICPQHSSSRPDRNLGGVVGLLFRAAANSGLGLLPPSPAAAPSGDHGPVRDPRRTGMGGAAGAGGVHLDQHGLPLAAGAKLRGRARRHLERGGLCVSADAAPLRPDGKFRAVRPDADARPACSA